MKITRFSNVFAQTKTELDLTWEQLVFQIENPERYESKQTCPLIKLAAFGEIRSAKNSLRYDPNVLYCSGIEADYDGEKMSPEAARDLLTLWGIKAVIYTSPSHTEDKPRWRVLAPLSVPCTPAMRWEWLGKLNGLFDGVLAGESFTLSQTYYYGRVNCAHIYKAYPVAGHEIDKLILPIDSIYPVVRTTANHQIKNDSITLTTEQIEDIRAALSALPVKDYPFSIQIGQALARCGESGYSLWTEWLASKTWTYNEGYRYKWDTLTGERTSFESIFAKAQAEGWQNPRASQAIDISAIKWAADINNHNATLDSENHYCKVDFLKYVDDEHLLKKLSLSIANATDLPAHTVFLAGLSIFSSITARAFKINYQGAASGDLPTGLYAILEQPSGTGKSRAVGIFQRPMLEAEREIKKLMEEAEQLDHPTIKNHLFTTNTTPEALDASLVHTDGYFSAVSSEQGLFNTLLGNCYGGDSVNNNDILLYGFDAGWNKGARVTRKAYTGIVVGSACMFSQQGSIENILNKSNGTGLAERFLFLAEKHNIGFKDFHKTSTIDKKLVAQYNEICRNLTIETLSIPKSYDVLPAFEISSEGWFAIAEYRNSIESHLKDGGVYSHVSIRGAARKINMQIMKIAANLQILDSTQDQIANKYVESAIAIADAMLKANLSLCQDKGIVGTKAEYVSVLSLFENDSRPRTERNIIQKKFEKLPFKHFTGNKSELIRSVLAAMVDEGLLKLTFSADARPVKLYSPAQ